MQWAIKTNDEPERISGGAGIKGARLTIYHLTKLVTGIENPPYIIGYSLLFTTSRAIEDRSTQPSRCNLISYSIFIKY